MDCVNWRHLSEWCVQCQGDIHWPIVETLQQTDVTTLILHISPGHLGTPCTGVLIRACTVLARTLSSPSFTIQFPTDIERVKLCVLSAERRTPDIQWMVTGWREEDSFSVIMAGSSVKFSVTRALLLSLFISLQLVHVSNFYFLISTHVWQTTVCEVSSYYFPSMNK